MIVMDVQIVEFPINMLREIGLAWNATGGAAIGGIWMPGRPRQRAAADRPARRRRERAAHFINPDGSGGPVPLSSSLNVLSAINTGLNAQLRLLEQNGTASMLAQPVLSTATAPGQLPGR